MFRRLFTLVGLIVALGPGAVWAQTATGIITGLVRDSSGAAVPGATVRVVAEATRTTVEAVTNEQGSYRAEGLKAGPYRLETALDGFETAVRRLVLEGGQTSAIDVTLTPSQITEGVIVTARRIEEVAQEVPIPVSVVSGHLIESVGAFNVNRVKDLIPTVQFYSTNPRNSAINIRGLGAPFGLTNDGIEPGVGLYIDGVFYARPAAATLDFLDVERIEVLRGPQGTLFGKNTTAGAINVTTRRPTFTPQTDFELNYGNLDFVQAKGSISGPLLPKVAGRLSFSGTQRDGTVYSTDHAGRHERSQQSGDQGTGAVRALGQAGDDRDGRPYAPTPRGLHAGRCRRRTHSAAGQPAVPADRCRPRIHAAQLQRLRPADRRRLAHPVVSGSRRLQRERRLEGRAGPIDLDHGVAVLGLESFERSRLHRPADHHDFSRSVEAAAMDAGGPLRGRLAPHLNLVAGAFAFHQTLDSNPSFKQEQGAAAARFLLAPSAAAQTPGLLDGYGFNQYVAFENTSAAVFGQLAWSVTDRLRLLPGLRFNYDQKEVDFDQQVYGGLQTDNPTLIALQRSIFAPQAYSANVDDTNLSGQMTVAYKIASGVNSYATYATGFKSVGLNLNGLPTDALDRPVLSAATVRPEDERHIEFGVKTEPFRGVTANVTAYDTEIKDFQAQVVNAGVGVLRGYLANAEKVRVRGVEFDGSARVNRRPVVLRGDCLHRRQVRVLPRCAAAARGHRGAAGQGHFRLRSAGSLQVGVLARRRVRQSPHRPRTVRGVLRCARHELSLLLLLERERLALSRRRRLFAPQRAGRLSLGGWLDSHPLVAEPAG